MVPIFVVSNRGYTGKTLIALGLALKLIEKGYSVGYIKPLGKTPLKQGRDVYDADAVFVREILSLPDPIEVVSPFVFSYEMQARLFEGKIDDVKKRVTDALNSLKDRDFVFLGGACDLFEGAALDMSALDLMNELGGSALLVDAWKGDNSVDTLLGCRKLLGDKFLGGVINKVPAGSISHVRDEAKPLLEKAGVRVLGVFQKDRLLEAITVRQLVEVLNGRVICCEDRLDEFVENFSVGAMDVDSALNYFRRTPNKAVITGAYRADIQLAAMETSTKCIILTGGLHTNEVVLGRAQSSGTPIISVADDTFTTIEKIESVTGKARIREKGKIDRAKELMETGFDMQRFLEAAKNKG